MAATSTVLVTGAAGFIGANLVAYLRRVRPAWRIISYDVLTYAGHMESLPPRDDQHIFVGGDTTDREAVRDTLTRYGVNVVFHLAAETHVDRSIVDPLRFVQTNVEGTAVLLHEARRAWANESGRFLHVSTDEVFGSLGEEGLFDEGSPYDPRSPYSASKAAADHLARAWFHTYEFPVIITHSSNNYGPYQMPEKLVPLVIERARSGQPIPVYGTGVNVRDWLFVQDHCEGLLTVLEAGQPGTSYCIGGQSEEHNIDLVKRLLDLVDEAMGRPVGQSRQLIRFVEDRPGHDHRYALDITRIKTELGWAPRTKLSEGLAQTVAWYLGNTAWLESVSSRRHREFQDLWYTKRGG